MRAAVLAGLLLGSMGWAVAQAQPVLRAEPYPAQGSVVRAEKAARTAAGPCEKELNGGKSGAACAHYHQAVLTALELEKKRFNWCQPKMTESSNIPVPDACYAVPEDMRLDIVGKERKVSPKTWKAFDDQMAKWTNR
jgi:hypothetical protein